MKTSIIIASLICFAVSGLVSAREPLSDHPLIAPYEGSVIKRKNVQKFNAYNAFTGMDENGKQATGLVLEGKVTKMIYTKPKERSIFEVFRNYQNAVAQAGAEILYVCNQEKMECAARYAGPTLQKFSDIQSVSNLLGRYLLARIKQGENTAYIAIAVGQSFTDIHVIEVKNMDVGMVTLDAKALGKGLDAQGFVILEGIYFDTNNATLQENSSAALKEISKLLNMRPRLKVYVVGHTDTQGNFAHNQTLSEKRAKAVVAELVLNYGIDSGRMEGHGVGPLAPQATNHNDKGRAKNRRVVLVAQ